VTTGASGSPRGLAAHMVAVTGEIDISTAPGPRNKIIELAAAGVCDFVIDLECVKFLDSTASGFSSVG
jgi:anti-anti-sigma factor